MIDYLFLNWSVITTTIVSILCLLFFFFLARAKSDSALFFRITLFGALLWTLSIILTELSSSDSSIALLSRWSFATPIITFMSMLPFTLSFGRSKGSWWRLSSPIQQMLVLATLITSAVFGWISVGTDQIVSGVSQGVTSFGVARPAYGIFMGILLVIVGLVIFQAFRRVRSNREKNQLKVIAGGFVSSALFGLITNFVFPLLHLGEYRALGPLGITLYLGATTFALLAYHLFDIRFIVSRTVIYTGLLSLILGSFALGTLGITQLTTGKLTGEESRFASSIIALLLLSFIYEPVKNWLAERTDTWLFQKEYSQLELTHDLSKRLSDVIGLDEGLDAVLQTLSKALHLNHGAAYVFNASELSGNPVKRSVSFGYGELSDTRLKLSREDGLVAYVSSHPEIINVEYLKHEVEDEEEQFAKKQFPHDKPVAIALREHAVKKQILRKLEELDASVVIPLVLGSQKNPNSIYRRLS